LEEQRSTIRPPLIGFSTFERSIVLKKHSARGWYLCTAIFDFMKCTGRTPSCPHHDTLGRAATQTHGSFRNGERAGHIEQSCTYSLIAQADTWCKSNGVSGQRRQGPSFLMQMVSRKKQRHEVWVIDTLRRRESTWADCKSVLIQRKYICM
jgi:hypothetical protein